jgi:hypothetical protein
MVVIGVSSAITVSRLEENNTFCANCHTPLEVLYVRQAAQASPESSPNLAAYHYAITTHEDPSLGIVNCVACHRGNNGLLHRAVALSLGATNTVKWLLGDDGSDVAGHNRLEWLSNASCNRCHSNVISPREFENHFHFYLPEYNRDLRVRANAANRLYCSDCHVSHRDIPQELDFLADEVVFPACKQCHVVWGRGPQNDLN